ncbi:MAG: CRISPR system precrRNA processing endoribonuclease RAMP protein Cas6 [Streptococcus sp.]
MAVKFHGFLMEQLDSDYVDYLHQQQTNPYATKVIQGKKTRSGLYICSQNIEDKVFMTLLQIKEVSLNDLPKLSVEKVEIQELGADKLLEIFNSEENQTYFSIIFETPTGFKSQGSYVIFPSMRLIFQSLMQKYGRLVENQPEIEEDTLDYLSEHSTITNYRLRRVISGAQATNSCL